MSGRHLYLLAVAALVSCATGGNYPEHRDTPISRASFLTDVEIANANANLNSAYDAIARLRPAWLAARGVTSFGGGGGGTEFAVVYVDGQRYGDLSSLRNIQAFQVGSMQYYDVTQAGATFGIRGGSSGVIEIKLKGPRT